jgi:fucose permease
MTPASRQARALRRATRAVYGVFIASGFAFATWASRIPQIRDALDLSQSRLGLLLLAMAVGSVVALPLAGIVVARLGTGRTVTAMAVIAGLGLGAVALGSRGEVLVVVAGLLLLGLGIGPGTSR